MPEQKYMSHSSEECFGKCIRNRLVGPMGSRAEDVKQYKKSENKWKKDLKGLKKYNKILHSITNKTGSYH